MNKVAFITGAGGYIGGETAVTLAKQGIKIAVCDIIPETVERTVKRIEEAGGCIMQADGSAITWNSPCSIVAGTRKACAEVREVLQHI